MINGLMHQFIVYTMHTYKNSKDTVRTRNILVCACVNFTITRGLEWNWEVYGWANSGSDGSCEHSVFRGHTQKFNNLKMEYIVLAYQNHPFPVPLILSLGDEEPWEWQTVRVSPWDYIQHLFFLGAKISMTKSLERIRMLSAESVFKLFFVAFWSHWWRSRV